MVVDNTPPSVEVFTSYPLFSPNGDGVNDTIRISQKDSNVENSWIGKIRSRQGTSLREFDWTGMAMDFSWDGEDGGGVLAPDGMYTYSVRSTDLAGNSATVTLEDIVVDTDGNVDFDGTNARGAVLPDGQYRGVLTVS